MPTDIDPSLGRLFHLDYRFVIASRSRGVSGVWRCCASRIRRCEWLCRGRGQTWGRLQADLRNSAEKSSCAISDASRVNDNSLPPSKKRKRRIWCQYSRISDARWAENKQTEAEGRLSPHLPSIFGMVALCNFTSSPTRPALISPPQHPHTASRRAENAQIGLSRDGATHCRSHWASTALAAATCAPPPSCGKPVSVIHISRYSSLEALITSRNHHIQLSDKQYPHLPHRKRARRWQKAYSRVVSFRTSR